jgi:hypothetical protein
MLGSCSAAVAIVLSCTPAMPVSCGPSVVAGSFVKPWQFDPADRRHVRIDTNKMTLVDVKERHGAKLMPLFKDAHEDVRLEQWAPGATIEFDPDGGLEVLVLEGGFSEGGETFGPQSWLRMPIGAHLSARVSTDGCPRVD